MAEYLRKRCGDLIEVASDNDDVKNDDDDDDDDTNSKDVEVAKIRRGEKITILDRLVNLKYLSKKERNFLIAMKFKFYKVRVLNKSKTISVIILCYNQVCMINFTSLHSVLKHFKLQQFNIISFLSKVIPMSSTYIDYLKYRYKSSKLYLNIGIKVVNCIMYLTG